MDTKDGILRYVYFFLILEICKQKCNSYEFRCPEQSEWSVKASTKCGNVLEYFCLLDCNSDLYTEFCTRKPDITRHVTWKKGQKSVIRGNPDGEVCAAGRYQPFKFRTDGNSDCVYKKSLCKGEGMIIYRNGSTTSDTQCRCDHTKGFAFASKTKQSCYCIPSQEDCSCYKKECKRTFKISPGGDQTDFKCEYGCLLRAEKICMINPPKSPRDDDYTCTSIYSQEEQSICPELDMRPLINSDTQMPEVNQVNTDFSPADYMNTFQMMRMVGLKNAALIVPVLTGFCFILVYFYIGRTQLMNCFRNSHSHDLEKQMKPRIHHSNDNTFKMKLNFNYKEILTEVNNGEIVDHLNLTVSDKELIEDCHGQKNRNKKLVHIVYKGGVEAYNEFIKVLRSFNSHLADKIEDTKASDYQKKLEEDENISKDKILEERKIAYEAYTTGWKKDDKAFINTRSAIQIEKIVRQRNCVLVVGRSGNGKSAIIRHIALKLFNNEGYAIIPNVLDPTTILNCYNPDQKQVFVIDNFCGEEVINTQILNLWSLKMIDLLKCIKNYQENTDPQPCRGNVKFLFATVPGIFEDTLFHRIDCLFEFKYDISTQPLGDAEKDELLKTYFTKEQFFENDTGTLKRNDDMFPLLCKLSKKKKVEQIQQLFMNHKSFIKQDFLANKSQEQICLMVVCVLLERLSETAFCEDNQHENDTFVKNTVCLDFEFDLKIDSIRLKLQDELKNLDETYFVKSGNSYHLVHKEVYDIVTVVFCNMYKESFIMFAPSSVIAERSSFEPTDLDEREPFILVDNDRTEKDYFDRLMNDLEQNITYSTFHNSQLNKAIYRQKFCTYCRHRKQKLVEVLHLIHPRLSTNLDHRSDQTISTSEGGADQYEDYIQFTKSYHFASHKMKIPLIASAWEGNADIVNLLVEIKCNVNVTDRFGRTALFVACHLGKADVVKLLLNNEADHSLCDANEESPLHAACKGGYSNNFINSALFAASQRGKTNIVELLVEKKANINKSDKKGFSPLMTACVHGMLNEVSVLVDSNACIHTVDSDGKSALFMACEKGHETIVELLLKNGADIMKCDRHDKSPLHIASEFGHAKTVSMLVDDLNIDIHYTDKQSRSPLFIACQNRHGDVVDILLKKSDPIDLRLSDKKNCSPLYVACRDGCIEIVKKLVAKGAKVNQSNVRLMTPLLTASKRGYLDVVEYLIENEANLDAVDHDGYTPLSVACDEGHVEVVRMLVNKGCDINKQDNANTTPLKKAETKGHTNIVDILKKKMQLKY